MLKYTHWSMKSVLTLRVQSDGSALRYAHTTTTRSLTPETEEGWRYGKSPLCGARQPHIPGWWCRASTSSCYLYPKQEWMYWWKNPHALPPTPAYQAACSKTVLHLLQGQSEVSGEYSNGCYGFLASRIYYAYHAGRGLLITAQLPFGLDYSLLGVRSCSVPWRVFRSIPCPLPTPTLLDGKRTSPPCVIQTGPDVPEGAKSPTVEMSCRAPWEGGHATQHRCLLMKSGQNKNRHHHHHPKVTNKSKATLSKRWLHAWHLAWITPNFSTNLRRSIFSPIVWLEKVWEVK